MAIFTINEGSPVDVLSRPRRSHAELRARVRASGFVEITLALAGCSARIGGEWRRIELDEADAILEEIAAMTKEARR